MISNILDSVRQRKNYYRDNLRRMVRLLMLSMMLILALIGAILYVFFTEPAPYYYATSDDGQLTQLLAVPKGTGLRDPES